MEINNLAEEINSILSDYQQEIIDNINEIGHETIKELTNETRRTAPQNTGAYKKHISWTSRKEIATGEKKYIWYVKGNHHRLTHLLINGHATRNGGRVPGDPFLKNAVDSAIESYTETLENMIENITT